MRIKDTLNLGKTDFPMRAGLPNKEPQWQKNWDEVGLYQLRQKLNEGKPSFILHDGPPYANGNIHIGHALNKISKEIIIRYKSMSGFRAPYVPGWDTHGLPIEQQLAKAGVKRKEMERTAYLEKCQEYALSQVDKQRADFKGLGILGDWENPYVTLKPKYEAAQIRVFGAMAEKGYIYKGAKPVYWSWSSESALAEAEIEYHDLESTSLYYANKVKDGKGLLDTDTYLVVWTTTPFTITASRGITVGPDFDYVLVQPKGEERKYVVAAELLSTLAEKFGWNQPEVLKHFKGLDLDYITTEHPWDSDVVELVMNANHVTLDSGTGLVHTAPGFGEDDWKVAMKYGLPADVTVDEKGVMTSAAGADFEGQFYDKVLPTVEDKLNATRLLLASEKITHSYPFDWRTKKPIIWRAVPQWFASIDKFRDEILSAIDNVTFYPEWGKKRLYNMIRDRGDWVISRQRAWGVPLPIFYAEDGTPIITHETIEHVANLFAEHGSKIWFEREAKELLPANFTHSGSPNGLFTKETDIMDVWFDSGSSWNGVLNTREGLNYPADLCLEGSDQYRGWFNSSLITSVAVNGIAPYKAILSQGFTLDGEGRKMSKSLGNTIAPGDVTKKYGADILRLWVASVDSDSDVRVSMDIIAQVSETYRKIRNTLRFLIANTNDFDKAVDGVNYNELRSSDRYILVKFAELVSTIRKAYDKYDFKGVYKLIVNFLTNDLSAFYLDFAKDVVYIEPAKSLVRRSMQTVFYKILVDLTKLLVPILPHTSEEIWSYLNAEEEPFAYLSEMPEAEKYNDVAELVDDWSAFMDFREKALKALEKAREAKIIGKSLEAQLTVYADEPTRVLLTTLDENIAKLLIVSEFSIETVDAAPLEIEDIGGIKFLVNHAQGEVCQRCRRTDTTVGADDQFIQLCSNCAKIIHTEFPEETVLED